MKAAELRKKVGKVGDNEAVNIERAAIKLGVGYSFCAALKKAAGINSRLFDVRRMRRWWRDNPDFKIADVYPRKTKSEDSIRAVA